MVSKQIERHESSVTVPIDVVKNGFSSRYHDFPRRLYYPVVLCSTMYTLNVRCSPTLVSMQYGFKSRLELFFDAATVRTVLFIAYI